MRSPRAAPPPSEVLGHGNSPTGIALILLASLFTFSACSKSSNGTSPRYGTMRPPHRRARRLPAREPRRCAQHCLRCLSGSDSTNGWQGAARRHGDGTTCSRCATACSRRSAGLDQQGTTQIAWARRRLERRRRRHHVPAHGSGRIRLTSRCHRRFDVPTNDLMDVTLEFDAAAPRSPDGRRRVHYSNHREREEPFSTAGVRRRGAAGGRGGVALIRDRRVRTRSARRCRPRTVRSVISVLPSGVYRSRSTPAGFRDTTLTRLLVTPGTTANDHALGAVTRASCTARPSDVTGASACQVSDGAAALLDAATASPRVATRTHAHEVHARRDGAAVVARGRPIATSRRPSRQPRTAARARRAPTRRRIVASPVASRAARAHDDVAVRRVQERAHRERRACSGLDARDRERELRAPLPSAPTGSCLIRRSHLPSADTARASVRCHPAAASPSSVATERVRVRAPDERFAATRPTIVPPSATRRALRSSR